MNKYRHLLLAIFVLCGIGIAQLSAAEDDTQSQDYIAILLNNQYMLENNRLIGLAEASYAEGKYDDAVMYAAQAERYAQMSDEYVTLQMAIKEANDAIGAAQARLDWARDIGAPRRYAETYEGAASALAEAVNFRSGERWAEAKGSALRVLAILEGLPAEVPLPAQYRVRNWISWRDCLWNIAGKPEIYGDPELWRHIYNANRGKLPQPNNPDLIHPGMVLDIPSIRGEFRQGVMEGD